MLTMAYTKLINWYSTKRNREKESFLRYKNLFENLAKKYTLGTRQCYDKLKSGTKFDYRLRKYVLARLYEANMHKMIKSFELLSTNKNFAVKSEKSSKALQKVLIIKLMNVSYLEQSNYWLKLKHFKKNSKNLLKISKVLDKFALIQFTNCAQIMNKLKTNKNFSNYSLCISNKIITRLLWKFINTHNEKLSFSFEKLTLNSSTTYHLQKHQNFKKRCILNKLINTHNENCKQTFTKMKTQFLFNNTQEKIEIRQHYDMGILRSKLIYKPFKELLKNNRKILVCSSNKIVD